MHIVLIGIRVGHFNAYFETNIGVALNEGITPAKARRIAENAVRKSVKKNSKNPTLKTMKEALSSVGKIGTFKRIIVKDS